VTPYSIALPLNTVEVFLLIATRVLAVLATSPVMSMKQAPMPARLGLGLFTALLLVPVVSKDGSNITADLNWTTIAGEALVGALAGFASTLAYTAIQFGASLLDVQSGFSMAAVYDATFGSQGALLERFYGALAALLFFQTDAHHLVIQALVRLFAVVPLGTFSFERIQPDVLARIAAASFALAIELVFPVLVALLLADIALAVLARVAPQFGIFSIGMQLKVLVALGALLITMPLLMPRLHQLFSGVVGVSLVVVR
jgi:flagellar biosynthesis protein FliR